MAKTYKTAAAFRVALETRLSTMAKERGVPLHSLRLKVVIERLLARLFNTANPTWLLKGGYAMELRYRPHARTTKDIDLTMRKDVSTSAKQIRIEEIRDQLQEQAAIDMSDYFQFRIGSARMDLQGAPEGGARFPCDCLVAGKIYAQFHIDLGLGDYQGSSPETLQGEDYLGFAGIGPAQVVAIPKAQQFAEKVHAYTFPWTDRMNTRTKDLIDLVLLIERGKLDIASLSVALRQTFQTRNTHPLPAQLPPPPLQWIADFAAMAIEADLSTRELMKAFQILEQFWNENELGK